MIDMHCPGFLSVAVTNIMTQSSLVRTGFVQLTGVIEESQAGNSRQGLGAESMDKGSHGLTGSASFLPQSKPTCLGTALPTVAWAFLQQLAIKKTASQTWPRGNLIKTILPYSYWEVPIPRSLWAEPKGQLKLMIMYTMGYFFKSQRRLYHL